MLTASCPKCAKQVTVPSAARPESQVRCPLCAEEYSLESIFADLPPLLVLLDAPAPNGTSGIHAEEPIMAASASGVGGSSSIFDQHHGDAEASPALAEAESAIALADAEDVEPTTHSFDFGGGGTGAGAPAAESITKSPRTGTSRGQVKKQSSVKALLGVVGGGLLALPLAQFVLWYLPGGWNVGQRDPLEIGQKFGLGAPPWVTNPDGVVVEAPRDTSGDDPPPADNTPPVTNNNPPDTTGDGPNDNPATTGNNDPPEENGNNSGETPVVDNGNNGGENTPVVEEPTVEEPPASTSPVKGGPTFTESDLANEVRVAKDQQGLIDTATKADGDGQAKRVAAEQYLQNMSKLAKAVTFAAKRPEGHMEHVHELVAKASDTLQKRKVVSTLASLEFGKSAGQLPGTVFMGTVKEIQQRGEIFETVVELNTATKKPMSVYTSDDPQGLVAAGDTVAVLGVIVDEPNKNIAGYKGEPDPVVWGGYWQVVPVEESP